MGSTPQNLCLLQRTLMRPSVYFHHVSRIAESMILVASLAHATVMGGNAYHELVRMNDFAFIAALLSPPLLRQLSA